MKKTKQIDTYYCDYCGKECKHTPEFVLPSSRTVDHYATNSMGVKLAKFETEKVISKQKDICPECQKNIVALSGLVPRVSLDGSDFSTMTITF